MRIAFSIIFNGLHHIQHKDYYKTMLSNFDYWIIVEGQALPNGSTSWCKHLTNEYQINGRSIDGTHEFLSSLSTQNDKLIYIPSNGPWSSKDEMVNKAIEQIKKITNKCFLWEVDIDEQWTKEQLEQAESELIASNSKTGCFLCEYYVTDEWISIGGWGEGVNDPYRRLWNWGGEYFKTHEPPLLDSHDKSMSLLSPKFKHYAYYFEKDVKFKNDYYGGHENVLEGFYKLKESLNDVEPLSLLFPNSMFNHHKNTSLKRNPKIHLLIDYYHNPHPERAAELDFCFYENINTHEFDFIHVFAQSPLPSTSLPTNVKIIEIDKRLTYKYYFEYATTNIPKNDIIVLSNSDIFFDSSILRSKEINLDNKILALTRWCPYEGHWIHDDEIKPYYNNSRSQDVWVWKNPIKCNNSNNFDFLIGTLGCDNRLAFYLDKENYQIWNPSFSIFIYHKHKERNNPRDYFTKTFQPGPYMFVPSCQIEDINDNIYENLIEKDYNF